MEARTSSPIIRTAVFAALAALAARTLDAQTPLESLREGIEIKALRGEESRQESALRVFRRLRVNPDVPEPIRLSAELEEIDLLMRLGRNDGVGRRLESLAKEWRDVPGVRRRVETLHRLLQVGRAILLEPNAVGGVEIGRGFRERFLTDPDKPEKKRDLPPGFPIRFLSGLAEGIFSKADDVPRATVIGFVEYDDLVDPELDYRGKISELVVDPRVLVAIMVYHGGESKRDRIDMRAKPWSDVALLWFQGTFERFDGLARRTRYEWLPGPSFFLVEFGGGVLSWRMPWDEWRGFERDVRARSEQ